MKNLFGRASASVLAVEAGQDTAVTRAAAPASQQSCLVAPVVLAPESTANPIIVKVELAVRAGALLVVAGWCVGNARPRIASASDMVMRTTRFVRADVAAHFERPENENHGFVLVVPGDESAESCGFELHDGDTVVFAEHLPVSDGGELDLAALSLLGPVAGVVAFAHAPFSPQWKRIVAQARPRGGAPSLAHGFLEAAVSVRNTGHTVVLGWAVGAQDSLLWLEDASGTVHSLDSAVRSPRRDVHALLGGEFGAPALLSGFVAQFSASGNPSPVRLKALTVDGLHLLGEIGCTQLAPDPLAAARWLFGIAVADGGVEARYEAVDGPLLSDLIARDRAQWPAMPVTRRQLGRPVAAAEVSVIVPLYGRFDFVESQMVEWARDPWIRAHAELIYVLDDPTIVEPFRAHAEELHRLYGLPFQWVWGGVNRGFSGANNLGALHAHAPRLLFLNSDVFPQAPGWLQPMVEVLDTCPDVGAVGPRLTFAEGGIQHAGMRFERLEEYGVWINRHPGLGLDPALDPARGATTVPAVTGACVLVRTADFEAIGGWDTGYLIGDFEDSDLCLKLRERGLRSVYLPTVQLTHLERQSMSVLGDDAFRMRVTLWNAVRHQRRWRALIEQAMEPNA